MSIILKNTKVRKKDKFGNASTKVGDSEIINRDVSGNITLGEPRKTAATTDVSQPFKSSEFESLKEYEQAKRKSQLSTPENIAKAQLLAEKKSKDIEAAKSTLNPPSNEELILAQRQKEELQSISNLNTNKAPLSVVDRNAAAGIATINSIGANLGLNSNLDPNKINEYLKEDFGSLSFIPKAGLSVLGFASGTSIKGISISSLFSSEQASIDNLQGDINKNVQEARRISTAATSKGANVQEAIKSLNKLEESIQFKYDLANQALKNDPRDIKNGLDLMDDMSYSLTTVVEQRQALERYALTGDPNEVLSLVGTVTDTENL